jgi:hypothetical protein
MEHHFLIRSRILPGERKADRMLIARAEVHAKIEKLGIGKVSYAEGSDAMPVDIGDKVIKVRYVWARGSWED